MKVTFEELEAYLRDHYGDGASKETSLFMKLIEEVGEVAEILNKRSGRKSSDGFDLNAELANELADVIHYTVAIAAVNGIDINAVILEKDKKAAVKYNHETDLATFINNRCNKRG